jgi:hypothetical protein
MEEMGAGLYIAADKFQIMELKTKCKNDLLRHMSPITVLSMLFTHLVWTIPLYRPIFCRTYYKYNFQPYFFCKACVLMHFFLCSNISFKKKKLNT